MARFSHSVSVIVKIDSAAHKAACVRTLDFSGPGRWSLPRVGLTTGQYVVVRIPDGWYSIEVVARCNSLRDAKAVAHAANAERHEQDFFEAMLMTSKNGNRAVVRSLSPILGGMGMGEGMEADYFLA